jgi:hypothetical protein
MRGSASQQCEDDCWFGWLVSWELAAKSRDQAQGVERLTERQLYPMPVSTARCQAGHGDYWHNHFSSNEFSA